METSYKEKYEQALSKAKDMLNYKEVRREDMEYLFPELKGYEDEDEKVRKALLEMVHDTTGDELLVDYGVHKEEALDWLEKQGEHANFRNKIQVGDKVTRNEAGVLVNLSQLKRVAKPSEKQGEKEPTQSPKAMTKLEEKLSSLVVAAVHTYCEKNLLDTPHFVGLILGDKMAKEWSKEILTLAEEELRKMRQKPTEKVEPKFNVGDKIYLKPEYRMPSDDTPIANTVKEIIRIDDKHYRFDGSYIFIEDQDKYELAEQKPEENKGNLGGISDNPEWREEDEAVLDALIRRLKGEDIHVSPHLAVKCLESLKGRVQPKPMCKFGDTELTQEELCEGLIRGMVNEHNRVTKEVLRTEYEKGRADVLAKIDAIDVDEMVYESGATSRVTQYWYAHGVNDVIKKLKEEQV